MSALTPAERNTLDAAIARRLGKRSDAAQLVHAYLDATHRHAFARTAQAAPVPTTLNVERTALLVEISRCLGRVIEDFEIEALFRVTTAQARTMRATLLATYGDITDDLTLAWSLVKARKSGRRSGDLVTGETIRFTDVDRRDTFLAQVARMGVESEAILGESGAPWLVIVHDDFPRDRLPSGPRAAKKPR